MAEGVGRRRARRAPLHDVRHRDLSRAEFPCVPDRGRPAGAHVHARHIESLEVRAARRRALLHNRSGRDPQILTWKDPEAVLREARFIAATRPGYDLDRLEKELPRGLEDRVAIMEIPALAISSTDVRLRAREGRPIRHLLPTGVAEYIDKNGLYRGRQ